MKSFKISEIRKIINGELIQGSNDLIINNTIHHLKKTIKPNTLVFIRNKYMIDYDNIKNSSSVAIVTGSISKEIESKTECTIILVKDSNRAYLEFVDYYRSLFDIPVLAVTGTSGKTTTKDMIKKILSQQFNVEGTYRSANGRTGHFSNLLKIDASTEVGVFETAVCKPGDITYAFRYFKPKIGVITNIGIAHLNGCKSLEGYTQAKLEMVTELEDDGILILNADNKNIQKADLTKFRGTVVYFGIHNNSDFMASDIRYGENGMNFILSFGKNKYKIFVPGYGEHQVYNALAAIAAVYQIGVNVEVAAIGLLNHRNLECHHQLVKGINGCLILDDTWNSNPTSLEAAFRTLNGLNKGEKRVALLGPIKDMGTHAFSSARLVGAMIAKEGVDILITVGLTAKEIAEEAKLKGLMGKVYVFQNTEGIYPFIEKILDENTIMLAKCCMSDKSFKALIKRLKG